MKITDDEREAAWELKWMIDGILFEREKAALYRDVYMAAKKCGQSPSAAAKEAHAAIDSMDLAFAPVCETCKAEQDDAGQAKVN